VTNDICRPAATEDVGIPWYRRNGQQREKAMGSEEITVVLILLGQLITAIGAGIAAWAIALTDEQTRMFGTADWGGNTAFIAGLKKQSRKARWGFILLAARMGVQFVGLAAPLFF
jgi:hypothetical protein